MRVFVAVELASAVRERIAALQEELGASIPKVRWVRAENLHLTLPFIGDTPTSTVDALSAALENVARDAQPFRFSLRGAGCFPNAKRARVIWIGVDPVPDALRALQEGVERAVCEHGFAPEVRGFKPHLTVARLKTRQPSVAELVRRLDGCQFGETDVRELTFFESQLSPPGATYRSVERFELGGTKREQLV